MSDKKKKGDELTYAAASAELEQILQHIETGQIDLDVLAERVERAATLLTLCRQRLAATETRVKKITSEVSAAMAAEAPPESDNRQPDEEDAE